MEGKAAETFNLSNDNEVDDLGDACKFLNYRSDSCDVTDSWS